MNNNDPEVQAYRRRCIETLTAAGKSDEFIAGELGISVRSVERHKQKLGLTTPSPPPLTAEEHAKIRVLLEDGCPYTEIARTLGRGVTTIQSHYPHRSKWEPIGLYHLRMAARLGLELVGCDN